MIGAIATFTIVHMNRRLRRLRSRSCKTNRDDHRITGALTPASSDLDWQAFDASLRQLETAVNSLRQRFEQIRALKHQHHHLQEQIQSPEELSTADVERLQRQLNDLEEDLESALFDWRSLREPFWQAVRFGGLGIVIGWILRGIARS